MNEANSRKKMANRSTPLDENSLQEIANRIASHPTIIRSLERLVSSPRSTPTTQFSTAQEELSSLFRWGNRRNSNNSAATTSTSAAEIRGNSGFVRRRRRYNSATRSNVRSSGSGVGSSGHYSLKEVVLLDDSSSLFTVRGPKKIDLIQKGCVVTEVQIGKSWNYDRLIKFFEELFAEPLSSVSWQDGETKFHIMVGIGNSLQTPPIQPNQELNAYILHRVFAQKIIWLVPSKDLGDTTDSQGHICEKCGSVFYGDLGIHLTQCMDNMVSLNTSESLNTPENVAIMREVIPGIGDTDISNILDNAADLDAAAERLMQGESSQTSDLPLTFSSATEYNLTKADNIIRAYQAESLSTSQEYLLVVKRDSIWKDALLLYKKSVGDLDILKKKFRVSFENENGIDAGAVKDEFFTKVFFTARKELFEPVNKKECFFVPKRSGGNLQIYKIFGLAIAHSILQDGPLFQYLAPWVTELLQNENGTSGQITLEDIPLSSSTGNLVGFIQNLQKCQSNDEIQELFYSVDGPACEQIVSLSDWNNDVTITVENRNILINILLTEETIIRRGKKVSALREGLALLNFSKYLHIPAVQEMFNGVEQQISQDKVMDLLEWPDQTNDEEGQANTMFCNYISEASEEKLVKLIKFSTGLDNIHSLNGQKIKIEYTQEKMPYSYKYRFCLLSHVASSSTEFYSARILSNDQHCTGF